MNSLSNVTPVSDTYKINKQVLRRLALITESHVFCNEAIDTDMQNNPFQWITCIPLKWCPFR